jgi:hypothetical protein
VRNRLATLLSALVFLLAITCLANASPIALTTTFANGTVREVSGGTGLQLPGSGIVGPTSCGMTSSSATLSETCSGSLALTGVGSGTGHFGGTAEVAVSTVGGISLGAGVNIGVWGTTPSPAVRGSLGLIYFARGAAGAVLSDSVTVFGAQNLNNGFLRLAFDIEGSVVEALDPYANDGFSASIVGSYFSASGDAAISANNVSVLGITGNRSLVLDVPFLFGNPQDLTLRFTTAAGATVTVNEGYQVNASFLHTATLTSTSILDPNRVVVAGAYLGSVNGLDYLGPSQDPSSPVPEPGTLGLLGMGFAVIVRRRLNRRRAGSQ